MYVYIYNLIIHTGLPRQEIELKRGCPIMLLRNLNPSIGLANGTRLVVNDMYRNWLSSTIITGYFSGKKVIIPRINLQGGKKSEMKFMRRQLPITLAFGMTVHKSQSQTLRRVGLYLPSLIFAHGMLYVAFSRIGDPKKMFICLSDFYKYIDNVVYKQLFLDDDIESVFSVDYDN